MATPNPYMNVGSSFIHNVPKPRPSQMSISWWMDSERWDIHTKYQKGTMLGHIKSITWKTGNSILQAVWFIWHIIFEKLTLKGVKGTWWLPKAGGGAKRMTWKAQEGTLQGTANVLYLDSGSSYTHFSLSKIIKLYTLHRYSLLYVMCEQKINRTDVIHTKHARH